MKATIFTIFTILGLVGLAFPAPADYQGQIIDPSSLEMFTDIVMFESPLDTFISFRNDRLGPMELIWESDGCSGIAHMPYGRICKCGLYVYFFPMG